MTDKTEKDKEIKMSLKSQTY